VLQFRKLDQQRKIPEEYEASRPTKYSKSRDWSLSFENAHKHIHSINLSRCGLPKN
jgi:hypothetical protein